MRLVAFKAWVLRIHCLNLLLRCGEGGLLQLQKLPSLRQVDLKRWEDPSLRGFAAILASFYSPLICIPHASAM